MNSPIVCPHCHRADWSKAPRHHEVLVALKKLRRAASAKEVGRQAELHPEQTHNILSRLLDLGFVSKGEGADKRSVLWTFIHD